MRPSKNAATILAARISSGKPRDGVGTISMRNSRSMAPTAPPTNTGMTILITTVPPSALRAGKRGSNLACQQTGCDRQQKIGRGNAAASLVGQLDLIELHTAEGCVAAEHSGQDKCIQYHAVAIAVVPVDPEQHRQITNEEGTGDVDQERAKRKVTVIALPDHLPDPPT